jgi:hypothetical protein
MISFLSILAVGFFLGMRHATDPDHVIAVTTIVSNQRNSLRAVLIGAFWGVGHTVTIFVVGCGSPKFCLAVKSTPCEISSPRSPAITLVHVSLVLSLVRSAHSHLSFTPELTPGKFGTPAATHRAKAQAPQTQTPHARHTFLGGHPPILVGVETVSHRRDSGNRGSLA